MILVAAVCAKDFHEYATSDSAYTIAPATTTTKRFGPSGSLKNENMARELSRAVIARMVSETFFDVKFIVLSIALGFCVLK